MLIKVIDKTLTDVSGVGLSRNTAYWLLNIRVTCES